MTDLLVGDPNLAHDPLAQYAGMEDVSLPTADQLKILYERVGELTMQQVRKRWVFQCTILGETVKLVGRAQAWDWYLARRDYLEGIAASRAAIAF